ncbi:MAG: preprotein translocase subunit SecE [Bellilinea sp.]
MVEKTAKPTKTIEKVKQPGRIARWWRETIGELRKVSWPTPHDAWRLTKIVLMVMVIMSLVLGLLDFVFSSVIRLVLG